MFITINCLHKNNKFYVKGADGKDLATYQGSELEDWYVWGNDLAGKIRKDKPYYYYKDHLGSVRAIVNDNAEIVAAYDYDAWGYPLEGRTYNADSMKFKYTGKELDKESLYDYFGARYYDTRIGRWGQMEPLLNDYLSYSPYHYSLDNPINAKDYDGKEVIPDESKPEQFEYIKAIHQKYLGTVLDPKLLETANSAFTEKEFAITNIEPIRTEEWSAFTGIKTIANEEENVIFSGLAITLNPDFFKETNKYVAAFLLEHELGHLKSFIETVNQNFEGNYKKFDKWAGTEEGKKALIEHEKNAIQYSLNRLEILKNRRDDNNKRLISKKTYKRLKDKLETYLNDQK